MADLKIRVLSVDDHPLLREGIAAIVNSAADMVNGRRESADDVPSARRTPGSRCVKRSVFLKTIIPSRKATKQCLGEESDHKD
jgi:hypothetical protein